MERRTIYWVCQATGWSCFTAYVLTGYVATIGLPHVRATDIASIILFNAGVCPALSHQLRLVMRRRGWLDLPYRRLAPRLTFAVVLVAAGLTAFVLLGEVLVHGHQDLAPSVVAGVFFGFCWGMTAWLLIYLAVLARRRHLALAQRALELTVVARDAQLRALRSQLNPHFLFNCLNSLRGLILEDPARAASMVTGLAGLLRQSLRGDRRATITLAEEMEVVADYLSLERVRFDERLQVDTRISPDASRVQVPPMIVQMLVENAITHGVAELPEGGVVRIDADVIDGRLFVHVSNTGRLMVHGDGSGLGLENAREQLRLSYGDGASLSLQEHDGTVIASLLVPERVI